MLRGFGISVEYNRLLFVESQIEASVLKRMENDDGLFLPPDIVKGRHVFFAGRHVFFPKKIPTMGITRCMGCQWRFIRSVMHMTRSLK